MLQRPSFGRLAIKTLQHFLIATEALSYRLDRDLAIQLTVERTIDQTHASATEEIDHFVLSNAFNIWSGHGSQCATLRRCGGQLLYNSIDTERNGQCRLRQTSLLLLR